MKNNKILFSFLGLALVFSLASGCTLAPVEEELEEEGLLEESEPTSEPVVLDEEEIEKREELRTIAQLWVLESSPTFGFSGYGLELEGDPVETEEGKKFSFSFNSGYLGYGDRTASEDSLEDQVVAHMIEVTVNEEGEVVKAIIDMVYDDLNEEMLQ
jgi:hypothetical protein